MSMLKYRRMASFIALTRDRDTGRVFEDPDDGKPRVDYTVSDYDRAHALEGIIGLAKMCYVTGAVEIQAALPGLEPFVRSPDADDKYQPAENGVDSEIYDWRFNAWLTRLREIGNAPPTAMCSSAHQMGTCRMSSTPGDGVVDPSGKVWGVDDLYIADASVFPTASGVNPMVTVMAIADWIATAVGKELAQKA
jgi:choline dehydrogenase-like flavoprotein